MNKKRLKLVQSVQRCADGSFVESEPLDNKLERISQEVIMQTEKEKKLQKQVEDLTQQLQAKEVELVNFRQNFINLKSQVGNLVVQNANLEQEMLFREHPELRPPSTLPPVAPPPPTTARQAAETRSEPDTNGVVSSLQ